MKNFKKISKVSMLATLLFPLSFNVVYGAIYNDSLDENTEIKFDLKQFGPRVNTKQSQIVELIKEAEIAFKTGRLIKSEQLLLRGLEKARGNLKSESTLISILGKVYAKQQQADKLLPLAESLLKRFPNEVVALSTMAGAQIVNKQLDEAKNILENIIEKKPKDVGHRLLLVELLIKETQQEKEALKLLSDILKIQANNPKALLFKTKVHIALQQFKSAKKTIKTISRFYPKAAIADQLQGDLNLAQKKYKKALASYKKSYQIRPNNKVLFLMSDLMKFLKQDTAALNLLNSELNKANDNLALQFKLGNIYQQLKEYPKAAKHFEFILEIQADNVAVLNNLAWNYFQQGNAEAINLAKKAYDKAPKSVAIADTYAVILLEKGDKKQALDILKDIAKKSPNAMDIQYHLALAYSKNSQKQQAIDILKVLEQEKKYFSEKKQVALLLKQLM